MGQQYLVYDCLHTEKTISVWYMLRYLGVPVDKPIRLIGDSMNFIAICTNTGSACRKRILHFAYHYVCNCQVTEEILLKKITISHNISNAGTITL